jgi:hypothetical protein
VIELRRVVTVGGEDGESLLGEASFFARDSRGRIFTSTTADPSSVRVFDGTGAFVTSIGRKGRGPGEFRWVAGVVVLPADSILVLDWGNRHATVFTPEFAVARTIPMPVQVVQSEYALLGSGFLLLNGRVSTSNGYGSPFHVVWLGTGKVRSFGYDGRVITPRSEKLAMTRAVSGGREPGYFWTAPRNQYRIERWSADGRRVAILERRASWFASYDDDDPSPGPDPETPPLPMLFSLAEDLAGHLWVFVLVADERWRSALVESRDASHGLHYRLRDYHQYYDTWIEVLDPVGASVVASRRLPEAVRSSGGIVFQPVQRSSGAWEYHLYDPQLARSP